MKTSIERIQRDIATLSTFTSTPGEGVTRFSFTKEDKNAREYIKDQMKKAKLTVYEDAAGTIVGRMDGQLKTPVIMLGSHYDSVKNGGSFDGVAGVVAALEIARVMNEHQQKPYFPIEFVAMIEEEGGRFGGGVFGSRAMTGTVTKEELQSFKDDKGISMAKSMNDFGFDPNLIHDAIRKPTDLKAFLELHIEQGPILESRKKDIGIVDWIVGMYEMEVVLTGRPDHAGTTPMDMRKDPLDAAAKVISQISDFAKEARDQTVATVGKMKILPGALNIVPREVVFSVDIRSKNEKAIEQVKNKIKDSLKDVSMIKGVNYKITDKLNVPPVKLAHSIIDQLNKNCESLGFSKKTLLSGAGHDAMIMAQITDVGLIFVPSKDGRSHCPEEWTNYEDLQKGIELLYKTLLNIAEI